jgi:hypothetical protein
MAHCPNCAVLLKPDATICEACGALFAKSDGWRPVDSLPKDFQPRSTSTSTAIWTLLALGAVTFVAWLTIALLTYPGGGGGPSPKAVLVISSKEYPLERILEPLESLQGSVGPRLDKSLHLHEIAYWYPSKGSDIYGVGVAKYVSDLKGVGAEEMRDRYFVEVYAWDKGCSLCNSVKAALSARNVSYFSACENATASTEYEKIRCRSRS